jgi:excisionase family DNA binding protein
MTVVPMYVSTRAIADVLGVSRRTVWEWTRRGELTAVTYARKREPCGGYTEGARPLPDPPPKTGRRLMLVEVASVAALLERMYAGEPVPPALLRRLNRMASER